MSQFKTPLRIELNDNQDEALLLCPLHYKSDLIGDVIVPAGFITDFASVPRMFWGVVPPFGRHGWGAVVHDWIYRTGRFPRKVADDVFAEAMAVRGVRVTRRWVMYWAVRSCGWHPWNRYRRMETNEKK